MKIEELAQMHKALSVPARLKILELIGGRSLCVNAITRCLEISQPAVSQHLAVLRRMNLVIANKQGYMVHYTVNQARLLELRQAMDTFSDDSLTMAEDEEEKYEAGSAEKSGVRA